MCGIAGFISSNVEYDSGGIVRRMLDHITYRGPDQIGIGQYGSCTMGMVRLSICDTAKHEIPIGDAGGKRRIVYNGEIYNAENIRRSLKNQMPLRTRSDAEIALRSYGEKGIDALKDFNGMYALAIWDGVADEVIVARDKVGEKPIYYVQGRDFFAFASEMKCLLEVVEPELNTEAYSYWAFEFTCGKETLFKHIFALEPGEFIRIADGRVTILSYWKIWDNLIDVPADYQRVKKDLTELIYDAVTLRTNNCAHSYGVLISGGLDSALVACITKPDVLFTCHYDLGKDFDELAYAQLVAKKVGRELIVIEPTPEDFLRTEKDIAYHLDTPCTWTSFSWWMLMEAVSRHVKVVMTGDGADEAFGGYHRYLLLHHDEQIHKMDAMAQYAYLIDRYYGSPVERYAKLISRCENQHMDEVRDYVTHLAGSYFSKMNGDIVHSMGITDVYSTMQVLLQMSDRMSMAFGVENRSPFLDHRLLQYAFSMSSEFKIKNGVTKTVLKDIAREFIPAAIADRIDKRGFSAPINRWFGLEKHGKYNRTFYRKRVFEAWEQLFVRGRRRQILPEYPKAEHPLSLYFANGKRQHYAAAGHHHC
ncbi:MAG: asparagine synthase (glutamine-hydrolyzing) [Pseudomonadota bacterium]